MAPHSNHHNPPDPYEQEWAIRELKQTVDTLTAQVYENTKLSRANHDDIISIKTRWAVVAALAGVVAAALVKLLPAFH